TSSTSRTRFARHRNRSTAMTRRPNGATLPTRPNGAEHVLELVRRDDLQLIVAAVDRTFVGAPALEYRGVPEPRPLHVVVLHFADPLDPQRFPAEILARTPAALTSGHPCGAARIVHRPVAPRVIGQGILP